MKRLWFVLQSMRPLQWTKNCIVFAGVIFGAKLFDLPSLVKAIAAFLFFCGLSGCVYLINDAMDIERDAVHPDKRKRPIASGRLGVTEAVWAATLLAFFCLVLGALLLGNSFFFCAIGYVFLMIAYSMCLKRFIILDALIISAGFVLRAAAGAFAVDVEISSWLLACTIVGASFLALCKRRAEIALLDKQAERHRENLSEYTIPMLDQLTTVCCSATAVCYLLYALSPETIQKFHTNLFFLTFFPVLYGLMRYLVLSSKSELVGKPERALVTDRPLIMAILFWILTVVLIVY